MNSRRSFIKSILTAAVAPSVLAGMCVDRFKWKSPFQRCAFQWYAIDHPPVFDPKVFSETWSFIEYRKDELTGLWTRSGTGIKGCEPCPEPEHAYHAPCVYAQAPIQEQEMIFHKRTPYLEICGPADSVCETLSAV